MRVIEASVYGTTVEAAAGEAVEGRWQAGDVAGVTEVIERCLSPISPPRCRR